MVKANKELKTLTKSASIAQNKLEFARKITEQRMSNSLHNPSPDLEEEIVPLYSTLVDEESFLSDTGDA